MSTAHSRPAALPNLFLAALPASHYRLLLPNLTAVELPLHRVLYQARGPIDYAYFPTGSVLSALTVMLDGTAIEVATIGKEGLVGHSAVGGYANSPHRLIVQLAGWALRIEARLLQEIGTVNGPLKDLLGAYHTAFMAQISQSVACNGLHRLEQRCCRWLLMSRDRVGSDDMRLTHDYLAIMLGARRASVTDVLRPLQEAGLLSSHHGRISIIDGPGLELRSCECYRTVSDGYAFLLGGPK